jgi:hypothetical protein
MIELELEKEEDVLDRIVGFFEKPIDYVIDAYDEFITDIRNKNQHIDYFIGAYVDFFKGNKNDQRIC